MFVHFAGFVDDNWSKCAFYCCPDVFFESKTLLSVCGFHSIDFPVVLTAGLGLVGTFYHFKRAKLCKSTGIFLWKCFLLCLFLAKKYLLNKCLFLSAYSSVLCVAWFSPSRLIRHVCGHPTWGTKSFNITSVLLCH